MNSEIYKQQFREEDAVGWMAIDEQLKKIYGTQSPRHYVPPLHYAAGGNDPLDGTSIYDAHKQAFHYHMVSYGMSELYYNEEKAGGDYSKWGFEFTFRVIPFEADGGDPAWAIQVMNNLARYVFKSGNWFEAYHFLPANGPVRLDTDTDIVGLAFAPDPELGIINTPHGEVSFLQMVGLTANELDRLMADPTTEQVAALIEEMKVNNPMLLTDLTRKNG